MRTESLWRNQATGAYRRPQGAAAKNKCEAPGVGGRRQRRLHAILNNPNMKIFKDAVLVFLATVTLAVVSCGNGKAGLDYRRNTIPVKGEFLRMDELIKAPYDMVTVGTWLVYSDYFEGKMVSVYDLANNRFADRRVSVGNGPGEAVPPMYLLSFPLKDRLYAYQRNTATLNTFSVPDFRMLSSMTFASSTPWRPFLIVKTKDYFIGETVYDKGRFGVYSSKGELLQTGGKYPFRGEEMERAAAFIMYQGHSCASPAGNYFASGSLFCDHIAFYEAGENGIALLKEHASHDVKASYSNQLVVDDDCTVGFTAAYGTASYCYMLFSGRTYAENGQNSDGGRYIIVFDWQGNHVRTLETDREIRTFCVDEPNRAIYATALGDDGEYGIMKFKL
ncbi:MAG: TolB-like 6-bladed beta-propeller domain-containing protein [Tannerella sp.]|jgi:hypothetical protein|nr:TolB-like 6-bladed beta-propeller domain-containing protein [Tannerella sp.]